MKPTIILDRDGVINQDSKDYIKSPDEWQPIPGSLEAIRDLKQAGLKVFVVTNQSGIGRGFYSIDVLAAIHEKMQNLIIGLGSSPIDHIYYCPHHPDAQCDCRKPKPGLLNQARAEYQLEGEIYYVGDSLKDVQAAKAAGINSVVVLTGNGLKTQQALNDSTVPVFKDLKRFAAHFLKSITATS